ncbi:connexin 27.5 [Plakobranchus ocellatus]|uniref:Connexin 27.5 n=1 Tax=Plakobranchus ocellatus TaxID=259542 RepID=A0AAV4CP67_9GAST|nr:connexin 27.5 [Plakobranchus ocellatus]
MHASSCPHCCRKRCSGAACICWRYPDRNLFLFQQERSERSSRFHELQDFHKKEQLKSLKHVATRWLSIGKCLDRLLVNWERVKSFFKEAKASKILDSLKSKSTCLYIMFLRCNIKESETFLTANQRHNPKTHSTQSDCRKLIRKAQICFVAPSAFAQGKLTKDVDYKSSYNHKDNKNIMIRKAAREFIAKKAKNGFTDAKIAELFTNVKLYFTT